MTSDFSILNRLLILAKPYKYHLLIIFLLDLLVTPLTLLVPVPLKIMVDSVIGSDPVPIYFRIITPDIFLNSKSALLYLAVSMQVIVVLLINLQALGSYVLQTYTGERLTLIFRECLLKHIQRLSFSFFESKGTADSIYRIQYDAPSIQYITVYGIIPILTRGLMLIAMICVTALINLQLALVALAITPLLFILTYGFKVHMRDKYSNIKQMQSSILNIVHEVLTAFRVVKAFGGEKNEQERFQFQSEETIKVRTRLSLSEGTYNLLINLSIAIGTAAVFLIGIRNVQSGVLSLGELIIVLTYLSQLYGPLKDISDKVALFQDSLVSAQRSFELLDVIPEVIEKPNARPIKRAEGSIEFRDVSFSYDSKTPVLQKVSFCLSQKTIVGIVGKTGAGKTTLLSLLPRFYDPDSGKIFLDGNDLREYRLSDLRNQFAIVLQETILFSCSIAENIVFGRLKAGKEEIVRAAKAANAHDFIVKLPNGYDTLVGERGMRLSGGERQRISLARAFLKDAPILILDEPTSSVDMETESEIMNAMERLMYGRTTFMISHRLSTLKNCSVLLIFKGGRLVAKTSDVSTFIKDQHNLSFYDTDDTILSVQ